MPILIDGHNLVSRIPELSLQDLDDEERLVSLLKSYQARTGKKVSVVFDPGVTFALPQARHDGKVEVVFAPQGSTADAVISRRVFKSRNPNGYLVITSDRELADAVSQRGARVRSSEEFAFEMRVRSGSLPEGRETPPSPEEVEAWLALFSDREVDHTRN